MVNFHYINEDEALKRSFHLFDFKRNIQLSTMLYNKPLTNCKYRAIIMFKIVKIMSFHFIESKNSGKAFTTRHCQLFCIRK